VYIGCDTGGTFTDFVMVCPSRGLVTLKLSSTPHDPSQAVLDGIRTLCPELAPGRVNHATTVATNALLEKTGGKVCFLTTAGFGDILWLGRGERAQLYALAPSRVQPLLQREHVVEVQERILADGTIFEPLSALCPTLPDEGFDAVAVCLLHSSLRPEHEKQLAAQLTNFRVFLSHLVAPGSGEYERGTTTVLAAYLSPKVVKYIENLESALQNSELRIVHSAGGLLTAVEAKGLPHRLALSGPAAGLRGALAVGIESGQPNLVTLDMGGTSTDVALLADAQLPYTWQTRVEGYPLRAPTLEIHTIGAGGGSVAWIDSSGLLRVGPRSSGAVPGPACYGRGGRETAVTDALCWNGFLPTTLGQEELELDRKASGQALEVLAGQLRLQRDEVADGILELACAHLAEAVRKVTTGQGRDPGSLTLFPFGGAGPLMACKVADNLAMTSILVPACAGVLSAWGALSAPWEREWCRSVPPEARTDVSAHLAILQDLKERARTEFDSVKDVQWAELSERRYIGQGETLVSSRTEDFHALHQQRFGFSRPAYEVETVQLRLRARRPPLPGVEIHDSQPAGDEPTVAKLRWNGESIEVHVYKQPTAEVRGPALVLQSGSTLFIAPGWQAIRTNRGHLLLTRGES
jgi:N-methylhydantoinase A/oxoprolinase/acetone carboxylase beta subunit